MLGSVPCFWPESGLPLLWAFIAGGLTIWYAASVWAIDPQEPFDENGRMPKAAKSFFRSCIILGGCFCYWFWSVLYHQNLWVTLDRYRKIDSIVIDRHIHDYNYFRWFHCGSRIAWPLRRIANPVVSHLGSSNLPCRAINQRNHQIRQPLTPLPFCGFLLQQLCATS